MTPEEIAAKAGATAAPEEAEVKTEAELSPDPLKEELDKVQKKGAGRTKLGKALYARNKIDEQIKLIKQEEGIEEPEIPEEDDENAPVTVGMLKKLEKERATKTAFQIAEEIESEHERELVKHYLSNTIKSSGNPAEDVKLARSLANSVKNKQLIEEALRKTAPKGAGTGSGAPLRAGEIFEPTAEEALYMKPPFNLTQKQIVEARKPAQV